MSTDVEKTRQNLIRKINDLKGKKLLLSVVLYQELNVNNLNTEWYILLRTYD